jgi:hypothetical protein
VADQEAVTVHLEVWSTLVMLAIPAISSTIIEQSLLIVGTGDECREVLGRSPVW